MQIPTTSQGLSRALNRPQILASALGRAKEAYLRPPRKISYSEWAETYRVLSPESAERYGKYSCEEATFQRGPMDAAGEPGVEGIVMMTCAQLLKTTVLENIMGAQIDLDPCPILVVLPTVEMAEDFSRDRLAPLVRDTPVLKAKVGEARSRDGDNTLKHKKFPGGHLTLVGANSPAGLSSRPIRIVLCDEVDRFPASAGAEGDPVSLALTRTKNFRNRKWLLTSTPTEKGISRIEAAYLESDQRRFFVPCPHCGHHQHLVWSQVHWDKDQDAQGNTTRHYPETAGYVCAECGAVWTDGERWLAVRRGEWRATAPFTGVAGFHINRVYSPWAELRELVRDWLAAQGNPERLKAVVNTMLGETWEEKGARVDETRLMGRAEPFGPELLPREVTLLTLGADVQGDRIEAEVVGWGRDQESWSVDYLILYGDPSGKEVWQDLSRALKERYRTEDGRTLAIRAACVDSGHLAQTVYDFCAQRWRDRVWAIKGSQDPTAKVWPRRMSKGKGGAPLFVVGVTAAKLDIFGKLRQRAPGPGYCHFPESRDQEWFKQLTAEKVLTRVDKRGRQVRECVKTRERNEALDCRAYAYAALVGLATQTRLDLNREADRLRDRPRPRPQAPRPRPMEPPPAAMIDDPYL